MLSPCWELVEFISAPVAISSNFFIFLFFNCLNKYPENTVPQHAHPLPPECVSCVFVLNIKAPQSL